MNDIYLILVPTGALSPEERFLRLCSPHRRKKLEAIAHPDEWRRSLGVEIALHWGLLALSDGYMPPPRYAIGENGRPELSGSDWRMSLAHSGEMALCALSKARLGVDLERKDRLSRIPAADWVALESYLKYTGEGLSGNWRKLKPSGAEMLAEDGKTLAFLYRLEVEAYRICVACREKARIFLLRISPEEMESPPASAEAIARAFVRVPC